MGPFAFQKATKRQAKARVGLSGPAGSGKTYTALLLATAMCEHVAVIDTEHGSASKYADEFSFDVLELDDFHPHNYVKAIQAAERAGYDGLVIDSMSHEWNGKGGCLELVELAAKRSKGGNRFAGWADITPLHNDFIEAIHSAKMHIFATLRSKMDYIQTEDSRGKTVIQKVGMAPITREGAEYELDIVGEMDLEHNMVITKSRCKSLADAVIQKPGVELAQAIKAWLTDGAPEAAQHTSMQPVLTPDLAPKGEPVPTARPATTPSTNGRSSNGTSSPPPEAPPATVDWTPAQQAAAELGLSKAQANAVWRTLGASVREATTADIERYCEALRQEPQEREMARKAFFASCNDAAIDSNTAKVWARKSWGDESKEMVASTKDVPAAHLRALAALLRDGKITASMVEAHVAQPDSVPA
jgi:hypothetical protein